MKAQAIHPSCGRITKHQAKWCIGYLLRTTTGQRLQRPVLRLEAHEHTGRGLAILSTHHAVRAGRRAKLRERQGLPRPPFNCGSQQQCARVQFRCGAGAELQAILGIVGTATWRPRADRGAARDQVDGPQYGVRTVDG